MANLVILCVEDETEVRNALLRDLEPFEDDFDIEEADTVPDAQRIVDQCLQEGRRLALVLCDHLLPGPPGVEFLVSLNDNSETAPARKVLVTGQAGLDDTVKAVNQADLDYYIAKPWTPEELREVVVRFLTDYVIEQVDDLLPYVSILDGQRLMEAMRDRSREE